LVQYTLFQSFEIWVYVIPYILIKIWSWKICLYHMWYFR